MALVVAFTLQTMALFLALSVLVYPAPVKPVLVLSEATPSTLQKPVSFSWMVRPEAELPELDELLELLEELLDEVLDVLLLEDELLDEELEEEVLEVGLSPPHADKRTAELHKSAHPSIL